MIEMSESIGSISKALVGAQADVETALKASTNPHYGSPYADLTSVLGVIKPALGTHGLAMVQYPGYEDGMITMTTILVHESGEWIQSPVAAIPISKQDPHGAMSGITYLRRGCASSLMALIASDDDGNEATAQAPKAKVKPKAPRPGRAAFDPREVEKFAKSKASEDPAHLTRSLKQLSSVISACEAAGNIEARHIDLAKTVLAKRGGGSRKKPPNERVQAATLYLSDLLDKETP